MPCTLLFLILTTSILEINLVNKEPGIITLFYFFVPYMEKADANKPYSELHLPSGTIKSFFLLF